MMKSAISLALISLLFTVLRCSAFMVQPKLGVVNQQKHVTPLFDFLGDKEREVLTRDSEPEEFFAT